jgi:MFS family permease
MNNEASQRWRAFALLVGAYFITIVDFTIVNVALPTIGRKLHFPESDLQWVVTAYGLTYAGFLLLGGRAADLLGRRRLLMAGLIVFIFASLGGGLATSDTLLIVMRGIQGLGAALVLPAALSTVMNLFPEGAGRNKALGIWGGVGALGGTVGLLAGGILTTYAGWQYIFFFNLAARRGRAGGGPGNARVTCLAGAVDQVVVEGVDDGGGAVAQLELGEDVVDVGLDGAFADH